MSIFMANGARQIGGRLCLSTSKATIYAPAKDATPASFQPRTRSMVCDIRADGKVSDGTGQATSAECVERR